MWQIIIIGETNGQIKTNLNKQQHISKNEFCLLGTSKRYSGSKPQG